MGVPAGGGGLAVWQRVGGHPETEATFEAGAVDVRLLPVVLQDLAVRADAARTIARSLGIKKFTMILLRYLWRLLKAERVPNPFIGEEF